MDKKNKQKDQLKHFLDTKKHTVHKYPFKTIIAVSI